MQKYTWDIPVPERNVKMWNFSSNGNNSNNPTDPWLSSFALSSSLLSFVSHDFVSSRKERRNLLYWNKKASAFIADLLHKSINHYRMYDFNYLSMHIE